MESSHKMRKAAIEDVEPDCAACGVFFGTGNPKLCSKCKAAAAQQHPSAHLPLKFIAVLAAKAEVKAELLREAADHEYRLKMDMTILPSTIRPDYIEKLSVLKTLCIPTQPWSLSMLWKWCVKIGLFTTDTAVPLMHYFAEQFSYIDRTQTLCLSFQICIATFVVDRYNLRRYSLSQANRDAKYPVSSVVDCYYGSDEIFYVEEVDRFKLNHHAQDLWHTDKGERLPLEFQLAPKHARDLEFHGIMCLFNAEPKLPRDVVRQIASMFRPMDWAKDVSGAFEDEELRFSAIDSSNG